jgi:hypothetical protein
MERGTGMRQLKAKISAVAVVVLVLAAALAILADGQWPI